MQPGSKLSQVMLLLSCVFLASCSGGKPMDKLGIHDAKLAGCPASLNCVSSDAEDADLQIEPFRLAVSVDDTWKKTQAAVAAMPRTKIITTESNYLHAECRSKVFGFVDDLELHLRPEEQVIAVRSAARLGYFDFRANRKRVEELRSKLIKSGVIEQPR